MKRIIVLLLMGMMAAAQAEVITWDAALERLRTDKDPPYIAVYVGHSDTRVMRDIRSGRINTQGVVIVDITAKGQLTNPFTNKPATGSEFIGFFSGIVQDYAAGTFFFLDKNGILQPHMVLPHGIHRNRAKVIELYCAMAGSGMSQKLSIAEFGVLHGMKDIANELAIEFRSGKAVDFSHMIKGYNEKDPFLIAVGADQQTVNPKVNPAIYVLTKDDKDTTFESTKKWRIKSAPL